MAYNVAGVVLSCSEASASVNAYAVTDACFCRTAYFSTFDGITNMVYIVTNIAMFGGVCAFAGLLL